MTQPTTGSTTEHQHAGAATRRKAESPISDKEFIKAMREALAANEALRANLYEIADDVLDVAKAIAPEDEGTWRDSLEARRTKYKKLGKTTRVARIVSTDDPAKTQTLIYGRGEDEEAGPTPAFDVWRRTAAVFNSPADD